MASRLYETLGVPPDATDVEIKHAYRKAAQRCHPDKSSGDAEKFKALSTAYEILSDPDKRKQYDETGEVDDANRALEALARENLYRLLAEILGFEVDVNVRDTIEQRLDIGDKRIRAQLLTLQARVSKLTRKTKLIRRHDGGKGIAHQVLDDAIKSARAEIAECEKIVAVGAVMRRLIGEYEYNEVQGKPQGVNFFDALKY